MLGILIKILSNTVTIPMPQKRRQKGLKVSILHFHWLFLNNIMAAKGLTVRDKAARQYPQTTTFEEEGEPRRIRTEGPLLTSLTPYRWAKPAPTQDDDFDGSSTTERGGDRHGSGRERERKGGETEHSPRMVTLMAVQQLREGEIDMGVGEREKEKVERQSTHLGW